MRKERARDREEEEVFVNNHQVNEKKEGEREREKRGGSRLHTRAGRRKHGELRAYTHTRTRPKRS